MSRLDKALIENTKLSKSGQRSTMLSRDLNKRSSKEFLLTSNNFKDMLSQDKRRNKELKEWFLRDLECNSNSDHPNKREPHLVDLPSKT